MALMRPWWKKQKPSGPRFLCWLGFHQRYATGSQDKDNHYEKALCVMQEAAKKRLQRKGMIYNPPDDENDLDALECNLIDVNDSIGKRSALGMFTAAIKTLEKELAK